MAAGFTVEASYVRALLEYAVARGADRAMLIQRSGILGDLLDDRDNRIPALQCAALMKAAIALCNEPALALRFGEAVKTEDLSVVWLIAGSAKTVGEARKTMNDYRRLLRDDNASRASNLLDVTRAPEGVWLVFNSGPFGGRHLTEAAVAWCVCETRRMLAAHHAGRPFLKAVHFTHEEPGYRAEYERIFGVPLTFGSDRNAMLVAEEFLSLTMPPANPYVTRVLRDHAEMLLERLARTTTVRGRVETILLAGLHESDTSMEKIATELGCSRQTLRRRLKAEGTSFEALLDQLRHKMAIHYLDEGNVSISEAAYMVGFSEPAAFSRAFKRWTGTSPRKRCL